MKEKKISDFNLLIFKVYIFKKLILRGGVGVMQFNGVRLSLKHNYSGRRLMGSLWDREKLIPIVD